MTLIVSLLGTCLTFWESGNLFPILRTKVSYVFHKMKPSSGVLLSCEEMWFNYYFLRFIGDILKISHYPHYTVWYFSLIGSFIQEILIHICHISGTEYNKSKDNKQDHGISRNIEFFYWNYNPEQAGGKMPESLAEIKSSIPLIFDQGI